MSEAPSLDWIGRTLRAIQAEQRTIRIENEAVRAQVADVGSEMAALTRVVGDMLAATERRINDRLAAFEAHNDSRLDRIMRHLGIEDLG